jgi:hypothetical protein
LITWMWAEVDQPASVAHVQNRTPNHPAAWWTAADDAPERARRRIPPDKDGASVSVAAEQTVTSLVDSST